MNNPYLSIIVPLHNEQVRLRETVFRIVRYCEHELHSRYEILLVDNGSTDETFNLAYELHKTYRPVFAFHLEQRSKAQAVQYGMLSAKGEYRFMCDCDLSMPIDELTKFFKVMKADAWDIVIGSRAHLDAKIETTFKRWMIGRVFQFIVRLSTGLDYADTQCGFKLFNAHAAQDIFSRVQGTSMAFDVEVLYLAQQLGYYCTDIPITFYHDPDSRVRLVRDSWLMLQDVLKVRRLHSNEKPLYKENKLPA
jgi:dolichyl-phosphate beta-glucosyltransferase